MRSFLPNIVDMKSFIKSSPSVALCQSGHNRLNDIVCNKLELMDVSTCKCALDNETISHFLFDCPLYDVLREEIWPHFQPDYGYMIKDWKKLEDFVEQTGRWLGLR